MISQMRQLENAARLAMGDARASLATRPMPSSGGLLRRLATLLMRIVFAR